MVMIDTKAKYLKHILNKNSQEQNTNYISTLNCYAFSQNSEMFFVVNAQ